MPTTTSNPKRKAVKRPRIRGPKQERLIIADDPLTALITPLKFKPAKK